MRIFLTLTILVLLSACQPVEVSNIIEYVPCRFSTSQLIANVDDSPLTKSITSRNIKYVFLNENGTEIEYSGKGSQTKGEVLENTYLEVMLPKDTNVIARFVYDDNNIESDNVLVDSKDTYYFNQTFSIGSTPLNESIVLNRMSAQFTAKKGHIPANTTLHIKLETINSFNWITSNTSNTFYTSELTNITDSLSIWGFGGVADGFRVYVELRNSQGKVVKSGEYKYTVNKNHLKTVTYNINSVNDNDGFLVSISDEEMIKDEDENQQIGQYPNKHPVPLRNS